LTDDVITKRWIPRKCWLGTVVFAGEIAGENGAVAMTCLNFWRGTTLVKYFSPSH
jgi:hypothetical protein